MSYTAKLRSRYEIIENVVCHHYDTTVVDLAQT